MVEIKIDCKTPTCNHMYGQHGFRKYLKPEGKELREYIVGCVKDQLSKDDISPLIDKRLSIDVRIYENWLTKKGLVKRTDISNREKFLVDSVFLALDLDDKMIFQHRMEKKQSDKEFALIIIEEIKNGS